MGIEQQINFNFDQTEKLEVLKENRLTASEENLRRLQKVEGEWLYDGRLVEEYAAALHELYSGPDTTH